MPDAPSDVLLSAMLAVALLSLVLIPLGVQATRLALRGQYEDNDGRRVRFSVRPATRRAQKGVLFGALTLLIALCLTLIGNAYVEIRTATEEAPAVCVFRSADLHLRRSAYDVIHTSCGEYRSEVLFPPQLLRGETYVISARTYSGLFGTSRYATKVVVATVLQRLCDPAAPASTWATTAEECQELLRRA